MNIKELGKDLLIATVVVSVVLFLMGLITPAHALEVGQEAIAQPIPLYELLAIFVGEASATQWVGGIGIVVTVLTQVRPWIPAQWVDRWPRLFALFDRVVGNYRGTKNERISRSSNIRNDIT